MRLILLQSHLVIRATTSFQTQRQTKRQTEQSQMSSNVQIALHERKVSALPCLSGRSFTKQDNFEPPHSNHSNHSNHARGRDSEQHFYIFLYNARRSAPAPAWTHSPQSVPYAGTCRRANGPSEPGVEPLSEGSLYFSTGMSKDYTVSLLFHQHPLLQTLPSLEYTHTPTHTHVLTYIKAAQRSAHH